MRWGSLGLQANESSRQVSSELCSLRPPCLTRWKVAKEDTGKDAQHGHIQVPVLVRAED